MSDSLLPADPPAKKRWQALTEELCVAYAAELRAGGKGNVRQLVDRMPAEGRSDLLRKLFAIRCKSLGVEQIERIAEQWRMVFPEFGAAPPQVNAHPLANVVTPVADRLGVTQEKKPLSLDLLKQIDAVCLKFEADLRGGRDPDVTRIASAFPHDGRANLLTELLRIAVEYRSNLPAGEKDAPLSNPALEQSLIAALGSPPDGPDELRDDQDVVTAEQETQSYLGPVDVEASTVIGPIATRRAAPVIAPMADYELLEELGRGGMGIVYKARQISLNKLVAVKMVLRAEFASTDDLVRFRQEAESAAQLDHPGLVPVFQVGEADGLPYFSMAYVEGHSLSKRLLDGPMGIPESAELVRQLAVAVAYAHAKGIVHRDLKPGNVLLDKSGRPRITDFGLAKRLDSGHELTMTGQIVGTPSYMPPEQARGDVAEIGPHSDIYSLGAVLYACLTGRPPYQAANHIDTLQQVIRGDLVRPSLLDKSIPRDLEIICMKCLSKRKRDRFDTAAHLALDLGRWQRGEPIQARPINRFRRAWMWCRRRPSLAAAASVAVVASIGFLIAFGSFVQYQAQTAITLKKAGNDLQDREQQLRRTILESQCDLDREFGGRQVEAGEVINGVQQLLGAMTSAQRMGDGARQQLAWGDLQAALRHFVPLKSVWSDILAISPDGRIGVKKTGFSASTQRNSGRLIDLQTGEWIGDQGQALSGTLLFAPDSKTVVTGEDSRQGKRFDTQTGQSLGRIHFPDWQFGDTDYGRDPSPLIDRNHGRKLKWDFQQPGKTIALQDIVQDRQTAELSHPGTISSAAFSPDGKLVATGCSASAEAAINDADKSGKIFLWDAETGQQLGEPLLTSVANGPQVCFSPDGKTVLGLNPRVDPVVWTAATQIWDVATRESIGKFDGDPVTYKTGNSDPWHRPQNELDRLLKTTANGYRGAALSPDGHRAYIPSFLENEDRIQPQNPTICVYDFVLNRKTVWPVRHQQQIEAVAISPDGSMLLTGSRLANGSNGEGTVILWDTQTGLALRAPFRQTFDIWKIGFVPHRPLAYVAGESGVQLYNMETGLPAAPLIPGQFQCISPDGDTLLTGYPSLLGYQAWDLTIFDPPTRLPVVARMMAAHPDGSLFVVENTDNSQYPSGLLRKLSPNRRGFTIGEPTKAIRLYEQQIAAMTVSPDGKELWLSVASRPEGVNYREELWQLDTNTLEPVASPMPRPLASMLAFSSDSRWLAVGSKTFPQQVQIWDAVTGKPEFLPMKGGRWQSHGSFLALQFNQDASRLDVLDRYIDTVRKDQHQVPPRRYSWNLIDLEWTRRIGPAATASEGLPPGTLSPAGKVFLSQTGRLYDPRTQQPIGSNEIEPGENFGGFAFAANDRVLLKLNVASIQGFDTTTGQPLGPPVMWEADTQRSMLSAVAIDAAGKRLVAVSLFNEGRLYDLATGKQIGRGMGGTPGARKLDPRTESNVAPPRFAAFSQDGKFVILPHFVQRNQYRFDVQARIWNVETQTAGPILTHPDPTDPNSLPWDFQLGITTATFSPDSRSVATAANDGTIRFWDVITGKSAGPMIRPGNYSGRLPHWQEWSPTFLERSFARNQALCFSPDGKQLLCGAWGKLQLWEVATGREVGYPVQSEGNNPPHINADGKIPLMNARAVPFNTDAAGNPTNTVTTELIQLPQGEPLCAALSLDGSIAVVGYRDGLCWTMDADSGRPLGPPLRHDGAVTAVAWSPNGQTIWTACADRTLRSIRAPTVVPTDPELATVWIDVLTGYRFSLPKPPEAEVPLAKLTLQRGQQAVSAPFAGTSEDWWRQQRKKLESAKP